MLDNNQLKEEALNYHHYPRPGKIEVVPTKPYTTQKDLGLAYSPGVAYPSLEIKRTTDAAYQYTNKGNLVAVVSNGTAVLGLGDIGSVAAKPVMEGKALLFKIFADIDSFDIEINEKDPQKVIEIIRAISGTFGGINLEDIKAPDCFEIEEGLKTSVDIPVMHDDQHGTAIISGAALINALELQRKNIGQVRVVVNGAGAASTACIRLFVQLGVNPDNVVVCDSKGVITTNRQNLTPRKRELARDVPYTTLAEAMNGADVVLGLSVADVGTPEMIQSMAPRPIVFALANPDPEIAYEAAIGSRSDIIFATGRSDYPNQVNNVLGFPYIFRGALDCRATQINEAMKIAAVRAIAKLAHKPVPKSVTDAYRGRQLSFGPDYIIPTPFDPRLLATVAPAVAKAATTSGVARMPIDDYDEYAESLDRRIHYDNKAIAEILKFAAMEQQEQTASKHSSK